MAEPTGTLVAGVGAGGRIRPRRLADEPTAQTVGAVRVSPGSAFGGRGKGRSGSRS